MNQSRFPGFAYIGLGLVLAGLICINPNRFTSIDSLYYLQSVTNLLSGRGYVIQENGQWVWNGTFPIGYPALIAALSGLTGLPILAASKLVNFIAIGLSGYGWVRRLGMGRAVWVLSIWGLGGFLKIAAYTWSETIFLVLLAEWVWHLHQFLAKPVTNRALSLLLIGSGLFLVRYIGGFVFGLTGLLAILVWLLPSWYPTQLGTIIPRSAARKLVVISVAGVMGMALYFWINQQISGSFFGGERFISTESTTRLAGIFGWATLNEVLLIRDFSPVGSNKLAWVGLGIQLFIAVAAFWQFHRNQWFTRKIPTITPLIRVFLLTATSYLAVLFTLRIFSPFSDPNLRLMAPFTFCLLMAGRVWMGELPKRQQRLLQPFWLLLILCSWLQLLPQTDISHKLERIWSQLSLSLALF